MIRFYLISPQVPPNPHLFPLWVNEWKKNGITINQEIYYADVLLVDLHTRIADYDAKEMEWLLNSRVPIITFDEYDKGGLSDHVWPYPLTSQQETIFSHIRKHNIKSTHFCRLLDKTKTYPDNLYPYEKPYFHDEGLLTADQLFDRPFDIVWIANTAPQRDNLKRILKSVWTLKCNIILGQEKIPLHDWINAHKEGKMFVSWSAGGYGDEKIQHLFSVAAIIKENNDQLFLHDFTHLENCLRPNPAPTVEDVETIVEIANDKERLYEIYKNGYEFVKKYYSAEYIALDILEKIKLHL
jgi:hypothetical protein